MNQEPPKEVPVVYTIRGCDACMKLLQKWDAEGVAYDERRVELNQSVLDEARKYAASYPSSCGQTAESNKVLEIHSAALFENLVYFQSPELCGFLSLIRAEEKVSVHKITPARSTVLRMFPAPESSPCHATD